MIFYTFGMQPSSSDTTKVPYVLRVRALRIYCRGQLHGFTNTCDHQNSFNMLNSKNRENGIRIAFSCLQDFPEARPQDAPRTPPDAPKTPQVPQTPPRPSKTPLRPPKTPPKFMLTFVLYWFLHIRVALGQSKKLPRARKCHTYGTLGPSLISGGTPSLC